MNNGNASLKEGGGALGGRGQGGRGKGGGVWSQNHEDHF